ncbi:MAG: ATP-binding protein [Elusimicrobiota bacterium]
MSSHSARVLLVDDDRAALRLLKRVVEGMGHSTRTVSSRAQAREALREEDFGALVCDVGLETADAGVLLAQEAGVLRPGLPVVLITGCPELETALPALRLHAFDYLAKPFELDALRRSVEMALASREKADPMREDLREELTAAYSELKKTERTREGMLAVLNHELRTPLCVARAAADFLAAEQCGPEGAGARRLLAQGLERLERTVSDILLHARLAGGEKPDPGGTANLSELAAEAAAELADEASVLGVRIEVIPDPADRPVPGDRELLARAIRHLVANAVRFSKAGGLVTVRTGGGPDEREISVRDEGGGIPPSELARVFDPYYQVADFMTRRTGGLGLGLAIVREVFESHGGGVTAITLPAAGCEFRAWLPARRG